MDYSDLKAAAAYQAVDRDYAPVTLGDSIPSSTLSDIKGRILRFAESAYSVGYQLSEHADRLHGPTPPQAAGNGKEQAKPMGAVAEIYAALDRLEQAQSFLAEQAGRNCNIA